MSRAPRPPTSPATPRPSTARTASGCCAADALQRRRLGGGGYATAGHPPGWDPLPEPGGCSPAGCPASPSLPPSSANACVPWASTPCRPSCCSHRPRRQDARSSTRRPAAPLTRQHGPMGAPGGRRLVPLRRRTRPGTRSPDLTDASAAETGPASLDMIGTLPVTSSDAKVPVQLIMAKTRHENLHRHAIHQTRRRSRRRDHRHPRPIPPQVLRAFSACTLYISAGQRLLR